MKMKEEKRENLRTKNTEILWKKKARDIYARALLVSRAYFCAYIKWNSLLFKVQKAEWICLWSFTFSLCVACVSVLSAWSARRRNSLISIYLFLFFVSRNAAAVYIKTCASGYRHEGIPSPLLHAPRFWYRLYSHSRDCGEVSAGTHERWEKLRCVSQKVGILFVIFVLTKASPSWVEASSFIRKASLLYWLSLNFLYRKIKIEKEKRHEGRLLKGAHPSLETGRFCSSYVRKKKWRLAIFRWYILLSFTLRPLCVVTYLLWNCVYFALVYCLSGNSIVERGRCRCLHRLPSTLNLLPKTGTYIQRDARNK